MTGAVNCAATIRVLSPMPTGSGAIVVHRTLARALDGYVVVPYNPYWTLFPPALAWFSSRRSALIHACADYGFFSQRPSRPLVITFHNYVLDRFMGRFSSRLQRLHYRSDLRAFIKLSLRCAAAVTAVSEATACLVREDLGYRGEMCVIPNGIDSDRFAPRSFSRAGDFVAAFSGNLSRRKGADLLPRIAQQLRPGQRIVCIGLRPSALPAAGTRLEFRQSLPNELMPDFYNSCDALLMPTVREGMSLAALEAMGCGLPIVATDCPSMREIVEDGKGGLLCPIGDAGAFTERLQWLADNPLARSAMGQFNRLRVRERHDYRLMASRYQQLFKGLHASAPTASGA